MNYSILCTSSRVNFVGSSSANAELELDVGISQNAAAWPGSVANAPSPKKRLTVALKRGGEVACHHKCTVCVDAEFDGDFTFAIRHDLTP